MKRSSISLLDVVEWKNLTSAFHKAAKGKRQRPTIIQFENNLQESLATMQTRVLSGQYTPDTMHSFWISDPKLRLIHAPSFRDRVLHHALIHHVGPVLDRALVSDTFACRNKRGTLAAVKRCQAHIRSYRWYVKVDMASYFASINQSTLLSLLNRKFKNRPLQELFRTIISHHSNNDCTGLPIGALTSQHFANYYLAGFDRWLLEDCKVRGMVRYMDDVIWWCDDRQKAKSTLELASNWLATERRLQIKPGAIVNLSSHGVPFCGYRVLPHQIKLSLRAKRLIAQHRRRWEHAWLNNQIDVRTLQAAICSVYSSTRHVNAEAWCREQLKRSPLHPSLDEA